MIRRTLRKVRSWPSDVRCFIARGRYGVSVVDTYSFDDYLAGVIARGVRMLREANHGHPGNTTSAEWQSILLQIEEAFSDYATNDDWGAKQEEAALLLARWFPHLWD